MTEFIPVSSSGHLVLFHELFGFQEGGLAFDVALHMGTLLAVVLYFRKDLMELARGFFAGNQKQRNMVWLLAVATIPAVIVGLSLQSVVESVLRSPWVVAAMLVLFGLFMIVAEIKAESIKHKRKTDKLTGRQAVSIGLLQACALIPGVSRSGATISGGLLLGLDRVAATRFSFLLAIPIIFGAGAKVLLEEAARNDVAAHLTMFASGTTAAFISGMIAIRFLLAFVARYSIRSFAYYRFVAAGLIILLLVLQR